MLRSGAPILCPAPRKPQGGGVAATTLLDAPRLDVAQFPRAMLHREGQHIDPVE